MPKIIVSFRPLPTEKRNGYRKYNISSQGISARKVAPSLKKKLSHLGKTDIKNFVHYQYKLLNCAYNYENDLQFFEKKI